MDPERFQKNAMYVETPEVFDAEKNFDDDGRIKRTGTCKIELSSQNPIIHKIFYTPRISIYKMLLCTVTLCDQFLFVIEFCVGILRGN